MDTNTFEGGTPDDPRGHDEDQADLPMTSAGERSDTVDQDDDGILPTAEPTEGGAPAP